ncbi:iron-sulfur cluster repair di-iron protein [Aeromicrobium ponti]|uniref:Regulator of cell morphogenesis and NO signaling n=1 Tax=Cytobacillus oceanisediminis TaxID=665099 RepID=A0A562J974_9BACI|nr:iron-sulfur cluster repair di-iron protein [Cytobacillus oceanisediminis]TWH79505.1 regulator of cell morphogenesis and NO signaling [Cytobacillus oceanisediminis]
MTMQLTEDRLVKDIVNEFPKTSDVFKRHRIDFCCGGNIPLLRAAAEQSADMQVLLKELNEVIQKENPKEDLKVWTESTSEDIIEHVINQYHRPLEEELSLLSPYVTKVARVHGGSHEELLRVHDLFFELKKEMLEHTAKEEESVFPLLLMLEDPAVENREEIISYIQELEKEHDHAGAILKELRDITSDFAPPADACGSYRLVYKRLEDLEGQTFMHVHLENNILFPRYI